MKDIRRRLGKLEECINIQSYGSQEEAFWNKQVEETGKHFPMPKCVFLKFKEALLRKLK